MIYPIHFILTFIIQIITMSVVNANNKCNSLAVVPYDDDNVSNLHRSSRTFNFGEHSIKIIQNWKNVGVAAVVWDAVRLYIITHIL